MKDDPWRGWSPPPDPIDDPVWTDPLPDPSEEALAASEWVMERSRSLARWQRDDPFAEPSRDFDLEDLLERSEWVNEQPEDAEFNRMSRLRRDFELSVGVQDLDAAQMRAIWDRLEAEPLSHDEIRAATARIPGIQQGVTR